MKISKLLHTLSTAVLNSKDDVELTNEQADKLVNEIITTDESFLKLLKNNTSVTKNNMKISEILKKYPPLNLDIDSIELVDKYFIDVEKTTNGLLTPSKVLGTILALSSTGFKNPKIAHDIAEKLLKWSHYSKIL